MRRALSRGFAKATSNATRVVIVGEDEVSSRLGHAGDVVSVRGGFARNYLVPRRLGACLIRGRIFHTHSLPPAHALTPRSPVVPPSLSLSHTLTAAKYDVSLSNDERDHWAAVRTSREEAAARDLEIVAKLEGLTSVVVQRPAKRGKMVGAVRSQDVLAVLQKQLGESFQLASVGAIAKCGQIKTAGQHTIEINVGEATAKLSLLVQAVEEKARSSKAPPQKKREGGGGGGGKPASS